MEAERPRSARERKRPKSARRGRPASATHAREGETEPRVSEKPLASSDGEMSIPKKSVSETTQLQPEEEQREEHVPMESVSASQQSGVQNEHGKVDHDSGTQPEGSPPTGAEMLEHGEGDADETNRHSFSHPKDTPTMEQNEQQQHAALEALGEMAISPLPPPDELLTASSGEEGEGGDVKVGRRRVDLEAFKHLEEEHGSRSHSPTGYASDPTHLHHLLELTEGETDLDSDRDIPDIFSKEDQLRRYSNISDLRGQLEREEVEPYLVQFSEDAQSEALIVGQMTLKDIQSEEHRLQSEYVAYQEQEAGKQRERQREVAVREERAKREVARTLRRRKRAVQRKEAQFSQTSMVKHKQVYNAFHRAEQQMKAALKARKAEVKTLYGDLERADGYYGAVKGRRWKVDWSEAPQPVRIKIKSLRGVRDKLPGSRYVLLVSLYDQLGGHVLRWSKLKGQQWGSATLPVQHDGHYYNTEIKFNQSVYSVLPSKPSVRPGMVLVFELFILRGAATPTDRVVGWGAFPISDADFNIIEGKYKCPFLRGSVDPQIDKHSKIEQLMARDIDNWLSNLYFEVIKMPRYLQGMHEYEVELQFSSGLLGFPDRTHDESAVVDGNEPVHGGEEDIKELLEEGRPSSAISASSNGSTEAWMEPGPSSQIPSTAKLHPLTPAPPTSLPPSRAALTSRLSRRFHSRHTSDSDTSSSSGDEDDSITERQRERDAEEGFQPVQGKPGLYYKVHHFNPLEASSPGVQTLLPQTSVLAKRKRKAVSHEEELQQHTLAVKPPFSEKGREQHRINERVQYVGRQFLSEMGLSQWRSLEFWGMLVILLLSWWIRLYFHYIIQYAFLRVIGIPINRFDFYPHTVVLNYQSSLLFTREEIAIVALGPLYITILFCLLILLSWSIQKLFGGIPDLGSRFIAAFGIQALLDPFWIFVIDMALLRYQAPQPDMPTADASKLYWHFFRLENSGIVGIFLTVFLYTFTTFTVLACYYMYFLRVHMNGRLIDIYHRLKSPEEKFFIPQDMEISNEELGYICRKAEQWRGAEGERRKIAIYDYIWEVDELDEDWQRIGRRDHEVTTHISIHTLHLDGLRELHRHFLRLDNGAIVEIFGELSAVRGVKSGVKQALVQQHQVLSKPSPTHYHDRDDHPDPLHSPSHPPPSPSPPDSPETKTLPRTVSLSSLVSLQRRSFASIPGQSSSGTQIHNDSIPKVKHPNSLSAMGRKTQGSLQVSSKTPTPFSGTGNFSTAVTSGLSLNESLVSMATDTEYLTASEMPHSSAYGDGNSALELEGYQSGDDSVFEEDSQPLVDPKGKLPAASRVFEGSPRKRKEKGRSFEKQLSAGQLV